MDTFQYLISIGLDPDIKDAAGNDLLCYASTGGSLQIVSEVLSSDFSHSPRSGYWSALHCACKAGNAAVVEKLIDQGLDNESVTTSQPDGRWSPASIAIFHGHGKMLENLSEFCKARLGLSVDSSTADTMQTVALPHYSYICDGCEMASRKPKVSTIF